MKTALRASVFPVLPAKADIGQLRPTVIGGMTQTGNARVCARCRTFVPAPLLKTAHIFHSSNYHCISCPEAAQVPSFGGAVDAKRSAFSPVNSASLTIKEI
jgi:hypothetical protein